MGIAQSSDLDDFLDDAEEFDGLEVDSLAEERRHRRTARNRQKSWRDLEEYLENKRLKRALAEYYDEDYGD